MRTLFVVPAILLLAAPAMAQTSPKPTQSADEIVCKLFNECGTQTFSADQKVDKASLEQDFTFAPRKPKTATRQVTSRLPVTPKSAYTPDSSARARPVSVGTRNNVAASGAMTTPGAATHLDMQVNFRFGSAILTPQGRVEAQEFAKALMSPGAAGHRVRIEGHTDAVGTREENLALSKARAESVAALLVSEGVARDRLDTAGFGFDHPLNRQVPTSSVNRRVEIVVAR